MKPIQVGLLGLGTVGGGVYEVLRRNQEEIARRAGRGIEVAMVSRRDTAKAKAVVGDTARVVADPREIVRDPGVEIVVELIGGYELARELVLEAIAHGKHVVTANKALLAVHGTEIFEAAHRHGVMVAFEASVAGGIPIIKALREGLTANRIQWIAGIINGTTNFILSEMRDKGLDFDVVLKEAQRLGYAEADPTFDIEGVDAAHKAAIMSAIAFGIPVQFDKAYVEGHYPARGHRHPLCRAAGLPHQAKRITKRREGEGVELRVHPTLVRQAADRQRRGRDERRGRQWRCGGHHPVLRQGRGQRAHRQRRDRRPGRRHPSGHQRPAAPRAAPGLQPGALRDVSVLLMEQVVTGYYPRLRVRRGPGLRWRAWPPSWPGVSASMRCCSEGRRGGRRGQHPD